MVTCGARWAKHVRQNELARVLYPVFVHCFLDLVEANETELSREFFATFRGDHESLHSAELARLQGLSSPEHLASNEQVGPSLPLDNQPTRSALCGSLCSGRLCVESTRRCAAILSGVGRSRPLTPPPATSPLSA